MFDSHTTGIAQETCRDLGHTSYGVAATFSTAETALLQGVDLVTGGEVARLADGLEFNANLLLKSPPGTPAHAHAHDIATA